MLPFVLNNSSDMRQFVLDCKHIDNLLGQTYPLWLYEILSVDGMAHAQSIGTFLA